MERKENAGAGVTLIELVVALTLGAIIMMAIGAMYSSSTKMLFGSVKGYRNQVEASLAVENMARRLENAVWVNVAGDNLSVCAAVELDDLGNQVGSTMGLKDSADKYYRYFYDSGSKEFRRSSCDTDCAVCPSYEVIAAGIETLTFTQQGADSQNATRKNVIEVKFQGGADSDKRKSVQITKINLRGRGSYGYYD